MSYASTLFAAVMHHLRGLRPRPAGADPSPPSPPVQAVAAGAHGDGLRARMAALDTLLIVTYGRSGSTLLQGLLNTLDGHYVAGENNNCLFPLYQGHARLREAKADTAHNSGSPTNAWFGLHRADLDAYLDNARWLAFETLFGAQLTDPGIRCVGFKEVRYFDVFMAEDGERTLGEYLDFLRALFSGCKFIFLRRDHAEVLRSAWWPDWHDQERVRRSLPAFDAFCERYARAHPGSCFLLDYRDMVRKSAGLRALFAFLDQPYDDARVESQLARPHSFDHASIRVVLGRVDRNPGQNGERELQRRITAAHGPFAAGRTAQATAEYDRAVAFAEANRLPVNIVPMARSSGGGYLVITVPEFNLAYFPITKCASTSLKYYLFQVKARRPVRDEDFQAHEYWGRVADKAIGRHGERFKFTVVRDPVLRLLSFLNDKVAGDQKRAANLLGTDPTPDEFIAKLAWYLQGSQSAWQHLRHQHSFLGGRLETVDAVYPIERLGELTTRLAALTGIGFDVRRNQSQKRVGLADISADSLETLIDYYADDYALLAPFYTPAAIRQRHRDAVAGRPAGPPPQPGANRE